jgi:drug/metabolite transporter (DMT)-like permease
VGLGTGITWATYPIFVKMALKYCNSWTIITYAFGLSALTILLPQAGQTLAFPWTQSAHIWLWLGLLALVPTVGGFCFYSWALNYLAVSNAVITAMTEIVVATIFAFLIFGDALQGMQILGGVLIVAGIYLLAK